MTTNLKYEWWVLTREGYKCILSDTLEKSHYVAKNVRSIKSDEDWFELQRFGVPTSNKV